MALLTSLVNLDLSNSSTDKIIAEYIWVGGAGMDTLSSPVDDPSKLPKCNFDGSSTGQATGDDSEVILQPQAIFRDPFRNGKNILSILTNKRYNAAKIFSHPYVKAEEPWSVTPSFKNTPTGLLVGLQKHTNWPLGWPVGGYPAPQGPYYCAAGANRSYGRDIIDAHYKAFLFAGINISAFSGINAEWEFQVGPVVGISAGDQVWVARYILERITEIASGVVSFDPKPIPGDWNGTGAHTNYSTKSMRSQGSYEVIKKAIGNLGMRHREHIAVYGDGNERRLTGRHEIAHINTFVWGVANRGASVRVGRDAERDSKGYLEDRRPASNMDPYAVTAMIAQTTILWEPNHSNGNGKGHSK
ncbi:hypothetical protein ABZP36_017999 [Zizania latifolia]